MKLEKLAIELRSPYSKPGPDNRYQRTLEVSYHDNRMKVALGDEAFDRILRLAGDEIAAAAQVQISDFVRTALDVSHAPAIEAEASQ